MTYKMPHALSIAGCDVRSLTDELRAKHPIVKNILITHETQPKLHFSNVIKRLLFYISTDLFIRQSRTAHKQLTLQWIKLIVRKYG